MALLKMFFNLQFNDDCIMYKNYPTVDEYTLTIRLFKLGVY